MGDSENTQKIDLKIHITSTIVVKYATLLLMTLIVCATVYLVAHDAVNNGYDVKAELKDNNFALSMENPQENYIPADFLEADLQGNLDFNNIYSSKVVSQQYSPSISEISSDLSYGWSDSIGGRISVTNEEITSGILNRQIVFNSISNGVIGDEKNFVGARENTGLNVGKESIWNADLIQVECGKEYCIRIYCHNNNLENYETIAKNTMVGFTIPKESGKSIVVHGFVGASNSTADWYSDTVIFTCSQKFHLEYISGSAILENNGIGANGGVTLSDDIVGQWVNIGYESLNGDIPSGYQYASYIVIRVRVVAD